MCLLLNTGLSMNIQVMYADQSRDSIDREKSVYDLISDNREEIDLGGQSIRARAYLSWFNFRGNDQQKPISALSGGELNRLALAQVVKEGGNLLLGGKSPPSSVLPSFISRPRYFFANRAKYRSNL